MERYANAHETYRADSTFFPLETDDWTAEGRQGMENLKLPIKT